MSNPRKQKGTKWESDLRAYLNNILKDHTVVYRPAQNGPRDTGDLHGVEPFIIQCKAWANVAAAIREGLEGAVRQAKEAKQRYGVAMIKLPNKHVGEGYAIMRISDWAAWYGEWLQMRAELLRAQMDADDQKENQ